MCCISRPYRDAQDRLLWQDKICPTSTWLMMSQRAFELVLTIMRRAFSGQSLLAMDQNWIQKTDSTIQRGGWVLCLQGTSAASISAAVRKEYCSALLCCLPQRMTRSELGAKTLAYPSSFLCWHDVIATISRVQKAVLCCKTIIGCQHRATVTIFRSTYSSGDTQPTVRATSRGDAGERSSLLIDLPSRSPCRQTPAG